MTATITKSAGMEAVLPPAARERNLVLPNGVDRRLFRPRPREEARRELGWRPEERVALFAADPAIPRKRYSLAELACRKAEHDVGAVRLHVAWGTPPSNMPCLMAASDCLLLTSQIEGSPNVVKEAVSCGLPVICTRVGDVVEVLSGVEPSWICSDDPRELAEALVQCLQVRSRSNGPERCGWLDEEQIACRLFELYERLASRRTAEPASASCAA
jgi:glycosyltransferase involved in cell wall biosynthesis